MASSTSAVAATTTRRRAPENEAIAPAFCSEDNQLQGNGGVKSFVRCAPRHHTILPLRALCHCDCTSKIELG